jgi:hypothetical protein
VKSFADAMYGPKRTSRAGRGRSKALGTRSAPVKQLRAAGGLAKPIFKAKTCAAGEVGTAAAAVANAAATQQVGQKQRNGHSCHGSRRHSSSDVDGGGDSGGAATVPLDATAAAAEVVAAQMGMEIFGTTTLAQKRHRDQDDEMQVRCFWCVVPNMHGEFEISRLKRNHRISRVACLAQERLGGGYVHLH